MWLFQFMSNYGDFTEQYPYYEPTSENTNQMSEQRIQAPNMERYQQPHAPQKAYSEMGKYQSFHQHRPQR